MDFVDHNTIPSFKTAHGNRLLLAALPYLSILLQESSTAKTKEQLNDLTQKLLSCATIFEKESKLICPAPLCIKAVYILLAWADEMLGLSTSAQSLLSLYPNTLAYSYAHCLSDIQQDALFDDHTLNWLELVYTLLNVGFMDTLYPEDSSQPRDTLINTLYYRIKSHHRDISLTPLTIQPNLEDTLIHQANNSPQHNTAQHTSWFPTPMLTMLVTAFLLLTMSIAVIQKTHRVRLFVQKKVNHSIWTPHHDHT